MAKATLLVDSIAWYENGQRKEHDGKGDTVDLPKDEFDRLSDAEAVAAPQSKDAKAAKDEAEEEATPPPTAAP